MKGKDIQEKIYTTFAEVASSIGYSSIHGRIIGVLIIRGKEMSLKELSEETGYSSSMVSLSLDLLEVLGVIKKVKKVADRNLYVSLQGDLLEILKNAIVLRVKKSMDSTLSDFAEAKKNAKDLPKKESENVLKSIRILEEEMKRLEKYINILSEIKMDKLI